ncbi:MAG: hypothetical protein ABSE41_12460 [Bacteroidota bacterium]|jgi:hypothetical protein
MGSLIPWIEVTIAGFIFVSAAFFAFLRYAQIYSLDYPQKVGALLPYVAIASAFLSYVVGFSAHLVVHGAIGTLWPSTKSTPDQLIALQTQLPEQLRYTFGHTYGNLVMLRLIVIALICLAISLHLWLPKVSIPRRRPFYVTCWLLAAILSVAYFVQRQLYVEMNNDIRAKYPYQSTARANSTESTVQDTTYGKLRK